MLKQANLAKIKLATQNLAHMRALHTIRTSALGGNKQLLMKQCYFSPTMTTFVKLYTIFTCMTKVEYW